MDLKSSVLKQRTEIRFSAEDFQSSDVFNELAPYMPPKDESVGCEEQNADLAPHWQEKHLAAWMGRILKFFPPDTTGSVGTKQIFTPTNGYSFYMDRDGDNRWYAKNDQFWKEHEGTHDGPFDPFCVYDRDAGRWLMVMAANRRSTQSEIFIHVSEVDDPTIWTGFVVSASQLSSGANWIDYPRVGFSADKIVVTCALFTISDDDLQPPATIVFDKDDFYDDAETHVRWCTLPAGGTEYRSSPSVSLQTEDTNVYLVQAGTETQTKRDNLILYTISGKVGEDLTKTAQTVLQPTEISEWRTRAVETNFLPQKGSSDHVHAGDDRMQTVLVRDSEEGESEVWCVHTAFLPADKPTRSYAQWWKIRARDGFRLDTGRERGSSSQDFYIAYPSMAINDHGDVLIGASIFNSDIYPSSGYITKEFGKQNFKAVRIFEYGHNHYHKTKDDDERNRWGDYSASCVDPNDGVNFWTAQECAYAKNRWGVYWAKTKA